MDRDGYIVAGRARQDEFIDETGKVLRGLRGDTGYASAEPGLWSDGDLSATCDDGVVDMVRGAVD